MGIWYIFIISILCFVGRGGANRPVPGKEGARAAWPAFWGCPAARTQSLDKNGPREYYTLSYSLKLLYTAKTSSDIEKTCYGNLVLLNLVASVAVGLRSWRAQCGSLDATKADAGKEQGRQPRRWPQERCYPARRDVSIWTAACWQGMMVMKGATVAMKRNSAA